MPTNEEVVRAAARAAVLEQVLRHRDDATRVLREIQARGQKARLFERALTRRPASEGR